MESFTDAFCLSLQFPSQFVSTTSSLTVLLVSGLLQSLQSSVTVPTLQQDEVHSSCCYDVSACLLFPSAFAMCPRACRAQVLSSFVAEGVTWIVKRTLLLTQWALIPHTSQCALHGQTNKK